MPLFELTKDAIEEVARVSFAEVGLSERGDLQRLLKEKIDVISPGTLIIAEEFGEWEDSRRRVDLLGIDREANIVVIELKRTESGGHMELQALRYAAMVSPLTFERAVELYASYLGDVEETEAEARLLGFLDWESPEDYEFGGQVRVVLASADFDKEITTTVLWLNEHDLDIRCVSMKPYRDGERVFVDVRQVIPLPEAGEYTVQLREKRAEARSSRRSRSRDTKKFDVTVAGETDKRLPKRRAILMLVRHLVSLGISPEEIQEGAGQRQTRFFRIPLEGLDESQFVAQMDEHRSDNNVPTLVPRQWFTSGDELMHANGATYAFHKMWGPKTEEVIRRLLTTFPDCGVTVVPSA